MLSKFTEKRVTDIFGPKPGAKIYKDIKAEIAKPSFILVDS